MRNENITDLQAELIKALANPVRLRLLRELRGGQKTATDLVNACGLSKANVSQHINLLKKEGLVRCTKRGTFCHYSIADPRVVEAVTLLQQVLRARLHPSQRRINGRTRAKPSAVSAK